MRTCNCSSSSSMHIDTCDVVCMWLSLHRELVGEIGVIILRLCLASCILTVKLLLWYPHTHTHTHHAHSGVCALDQRTPSRFLATRGLPQRANVV